MDVSVRAKERFCKDCNIPLRIFQEPYFMDRLRLYDRFYGTMEKWVLFTEELEKYHCEQDYFEEYNQIKDAAIVSIKESKGYQRFQEEDMNLFAVSHKNLPGKDIFKASFDGKMLISVDMKKANFSALHHYAADMFQGADGTADSWEAFIGGFTKNRHIVQSKYIRQVILGNCNPKRHITYERYLMDGVLTQLCETCFSIERVVFFSNDEIVVDVSDLEKEKQQELEEKISSCILKLPVPLRVERFLLRKIKGTEGYYKKIYKGGGKSQIEFKCLDNYMLPFVLRAFLGEKVTDSDRTFYHEGLLARFVEIPEIKIDEKE